MECENWNSSKYDEYLECEVYHWGCQQHEMTIKLFSMLHKHHKRASRGCVVQKLIWVQHETIFSFCYFHFIFMITWYRKIPFLYAKCLLKILETAHSSLEAFSGIRNQNTQDAKMSFSVLLVSLYLYDAIQTIYMWLLGVAELSSMSTLKFLAFIHENETRSYDENINTGEK